MKKLIYLLTIVTTVFIFSSCQKAPDAKDITGTWEVYSVENYDAEDKLLDSWAQPLGTYVLQEGGVCVVTYKSNGMSFNWSWSYDKSTKVLSLTTNNDWGTVSLNIIEFDDQNAKAKVEKDPETSNIAYRLISARKK